ncbi:MAG: 4Fe-4S dicluster domain-containing protein [Thermoplasmata archaeon]|nr:4Fe-4S dicluster domain-containing protein [Thermoplasmata archaeon]
MSGRSSGPGPGPSAASSVERPALGSRHVLERTEFPSLLRSLRTAGYRTVGPTIRDGAIVYGEIRQESDLPIGWTDRQEAGRYRLEQRADAALFGYNVGPHSWKKYLFPSRERLFTAVRDGRSFVVQPEPVDPTPLAFLGVRACELAALGVSDRVFGKAGDPSYAERRTRTLRIAVQCGQAGATCFCVSMKTGPAVTGGHDLSLTEVLHEGRHYFLVEVGSESGARILDGVPLRPATEDEFRSAVASVGRAAASMGRTMDTNGLRDLLVLNPENPRWEIVARRCLSCTNCTMACPTCFCQTTEEVPDLSAEKSERWRRWDSCFNSGFTAVHGTSVRSTTQSRYRQWLTHKLGTWYDQFGESGCVGCGRCITWCPVGIDLTEEVAAVRTAPGDAPGGRVAP